MEFKDLCDHDKIKVLQLRIDMKDRAIARLQAQVKRLGKVAEVKDQWIAKALKVMDYFKKEKASPHLCGPLMCEYCGCHVMAYDSRHLLDRCPALQAFELKSAALKEPTE